MTAELEQRILDAPDDLGARAVYADWLQEQGDPRGTYAALAMGDDPLAAWHYLTQHRAAVLGPGETLLNIGRVHFVGGFVDELQFLTSGHETGMPDEALAHPAFRFVRHIALGSATNNHRLVSALHDARLPMLSSLTCTQPKNIERLAGLGITRLGISSPIPISGELRGVTEVWARTSDFVDTWLADGGCPDASHVEKLSRHENRYVHDALVRLRNGGFRRESVRMLTSPGTALALSLSEMLPRSPEWRQTLAVAVTYLETEPLWLELALAQLEVGEEALAEVSIREGLRRGPRHQVDELQAMLTESSRRHLPRS